MAEDAVNKDADCSGSCNVSADLDAEGKSNRRKRSDIAQLLDFAGGRKWLTYAGVGAEWHLASSGIRSVCVYMACGA